MCNTYILYYITKIYLSFLYKCENFYFEKFVN